MLLLAGGCGTVTGLDPYEFFSAWSLEGGDRAMPVGIATAPHGDLFVTVLNREDDSPGILRYGTDGRLVSRIALPPDETWETSFPNDVAVNRSGYVYVTDARGGPAQAGAVLVFSPDGRFIDWWQPWDEVDEDWIYGIGIGPDEDVYVTDHLADTVRRFTAGGDPVAVYGGPSGSEPGPFEMPQDVAVGVDGTCYVTNMVLGEYEERGFITRFVPGGSWTRREFHGFWPILDALDDAGNLYVANIDESEQMAPLDGVSIGYAVYSYAPDGTLRAVMGGNNQHRHRSLASDRLFSVAADAGITADGWVRRPIGVTVGREGTVWLTDVAGPAVLAWRPYSAPAGPLSASFAISPQTGTAPLALRFLDYSTGAVGWSWDFGDGTTSAEHAPYHLYEEPGRYTVSLTVTDAAGRTATETKFGAVLAFGPTTAPTPTPTVDFRSNRTWGSAPMTVAFTDDSTGDPNAWSWEFGDGGTSADRAPVHTYTGPGTYLVNLTILTPTGIYRSASPLAIDVEPDERAPVANFTASRTSGAPPLFVRFTDTSTGNPTSWRWDFGGLAWSTMHHPAAIFRQPGAYAVTLTVTNAFGSSTVTKSITATGAAQRTSRGPAVTVVG
jgi:PKD repeat protein